MSVATDEHLRPVRRKPRSIWERSGLTPGQERGLNIALALLVVLFVAGWGYSLWSALEQDLPPQVVREIARTPVSTAAAPNTTFLLDAALRRFTDWDDIRGESGEVLVTFQQPGGTLALPDSLPAGVQVALQSVGGSDTVPIAAASTAAPTAPGVWNVLVQMRNAGRSIPVPDLRIVSLVGAEEKRSGKIGDYLLGDWPSETGVYTPPRGFVRVTPENRDLPVSTHFQLGDFLTKGQENVWPKYVVLSPRLLDKLELTLRELEEAGHPVKDVFVVSGFRTPWYNKRGGDPRGRGSLSRHMYGDAADIAIDNNGDNRMDDLNGDGRVNVQDARIVAEAAERVEREHPELVGGIGIYKPTGAHAGMVHIDARGTRARWGAW